MGEARRPASEGAARILIVDDHPAVREGLGIRIDRQEGLVVCGEASGISEALRLVDSTDPDLVVIDISLAEGDGIDLIHRVRARSPRARMLVWSMYPESLLFSKHRPSTGRIALPDVLNLAYTPLSMIQVGTRAKGIMG